MEGGVVPNKIAIGYARAQKLGLKIFGMAYTKAYAADEIHELLGDARPLLLFSNFDVPSGRVWTEREWLPGCTHQALLIGLEPIQKDTAEAIVRELALWSNRQKQMGCVLKFKGEPPDPTGLWALLERAEKLLK